jgi:hypothetical protein
MVDENAIREWLTRGYLSSAHYNRSNIIHRRLTNFIAVGLTCTLPQDITICVLTAGNTNTIFREPDSITYYYVVGALVAACAHLLIRLYAEGIRGYCAIKQCNKNDRQCVQDPTVVSKGERQWQWYQSRQ